MQIKELWAEFIFQSRIADQMHSGGTLHRKHNGGVRRPLPRSPRSCSDLSYSYIVRRHE